MSRGGDHLSHGAAGGGHAIRIEDGGAVAGVIEETELDEPTFVEVQNGETGVLAFFFRLGSTIWDGEGIGHQSAEALGNWFVIGATVEDFGASGFAVGGVAVDGEHAVAFVGAGDVVAAGDRRGIDGIAAGANDRVAGGAQDVAEAVGVTHRDVGLGDLLLFDGDDGSGIILAAAFVVAAVAGVNANGEGHAGDEVSKRGGTGWKAYTTRTQNGLAGEGEAVGVSRRLREAAPAACCVM